MIDRTAPLKIADIGCGTRASTIFPAHLLKAQIAAVDVLRDFLDVLEVRAVNMGLSAEITSLCCSMDDLPFGAQEYEFIWSEGAIHNIGFEKGLKEWNRFLKTGGMMIVSEIT